MDEILGVVLGWMLALIGRVLIFIGTFGRWKCEGIISTEHRMRSAAGALSYVRDGRRVVTPLGQMIAGSALCVALVIFLVGLISIH